jgi:gamma-glutamylcyclotransferase (GGCT)/AIG2-like uncharacterized protein YtfP
MREPSLNEVTCLLDAANVVRWNYGADDSYLATRAADAERELESLFAISTTLAVYGTLAPGRANHHIVAPLGGEWTEGVIEGDLIAAGWGATYGYPAFRPRVGGVEVPVQVLRSARLISAWPAIDRFEGSGYRRILVPVFAPGEAIHRKLRTVANLYASATAFPDANHPR